MPLDVNSLIQMLGGMGPQALGADTPPSYQGPGMTPPLGASPLGVMQPGLPPAPGAYDPSDPRDPAAPGGGNPSAPGGWLHRLAQGFSQGMKGGTAGIGSMSNQAPPASGAGGMGHGLGHILQGILGGASGGMGGGNIDPRVLALLQQLMAQQQAPPQSAGSASIPPALGGAGGMPPWLGMNRPS